MNVNMPLVWMKVLSNLNLFISDMEKFENLGFCLNILILDTCPSEVG